MAGGWTSIIANAAARRDKGHGDLGQVCCACQKHYRKNGRSTGTAENFKPVLSLVRKLYAETPVSDFGPLAIKALMARMVDLGQSRPYVNDNAQRIKRIFRWAIDSVIDVDAFNVELEAEKQDAAWLAGVRKTVHEALRGIDLGGTES